jgi:phosphate-selective porin OprO and OprP
MGESIMKKNQWVPAIGLLAGLLVWGTAARRAAAQEADSKAATDAQRIAALEEKLRAVEERLLLLERKLDEGNSPLVASNGAIPAAAVPVPSPVGTNLPAPAAQVVASSPAAAPSVSAGPEGFSIQSPTGDFQLKIRYQMAVDGRFAANPHAEPDSFFVRRAEPILDATLYKQFSVHVLTDFGEGKQRVIDAYFDTTFAPWLKLRIGKFKGPVGLERLRSGQVTPFMERALPTQLVPSRDIGLELYGDLFRARLSYAAGVFDGVPDAGSTDGDTEDHKEFEGRVFAQPFQQGRLHLLNGLGLGVGGSYGEAGAALPQFSTTGQTVFFAYNPATAGNGIHYRLTPQGYYYHGPFGLLGEYVISTQDVKRQVSGQILSATLENAAWQVETSYVLTREDASYNGVNPSRVFDPGKGTWGAFELAARYDALRVDRAAFPVLADGTNARAARAWAFGLNWYMNRNVRWMFDFERTDFDLAPGHPADLQLPREKLFLQRFQLRF